MPTQQYDALYDIIVALISSLPPSFTYHNLGHTLDVVKESQAIAAAEGITDADDLLRLRTAALLHDVGFVKTYNTHEMVGCVLAEPLLQEFGYTPADIEAIKRMIMATEIPQNPLDQLSAILCDADLDYLGRPDFYAIAQTLKTEWINHQIMASEDEWEARQLTFLRGHRYFTPSGIQRREKQKQQYIRQLSQE
jgi:HD superfamily phosphodiesterase